MILGQPLLAGLILRGILLSAQMPRLKQTQFVPFACCAVDGDFNDPENACIKSQWEESVVRPIHRFANRGICIGGMR